MKKCYGKRPGAVFMSVVMIALLLGGCQKRDAATGDGTKIYYTAIESGDYYEGWANQLQEQAKKSGCDFDVGYAENSVETQEAQVKGAVSNGYNVLLCGLVSADIATEIKAAAKDVPIVFINQAPDDRQLMKNRYVYVASDEYMAGQYQAEYILEKFKGKEEINVAILKGPKGASGAIGRTNGLKQTLKASGKKIHYVFEDNADWSAETAQEMIGMLLKTGRTVDCVAANNDDMAQGAVTAFEEAGIDLNSVLFLGVDASETGCQSIADGKMDFTVYQPTSEQISVAVEAARKLAEGKSIEDMDGVSEDGKYILIPFEKVDASNVAKYM